MRPINKIAIIALFVGMMIWVGCAGARWAEEQSQAFEQSHQQAMSVLGGK